MMTQFKATACIEYRIVLLCPHSDAVVALNAEGRRSQLPRVELAPHTRMAPLLHRALETTWGLRGTILEIIAGPEGLSPCVVFELFEQGLPEFMRAVSLEEISMCELSETERATVVSIQHGVIANILARRGWIDEAIEWVETVMRQRIQSRLAIRQHNAGMGFALLQFHLQDGQSVWLKAVEKPNTQELKITEVLSKLCSGWIPDVLAVQLAWNAWLMPGITVNEKAMSLSPSTRMRMLESAVESMAALQVRTIGHEAEVLSAGGSDQRVPVLRENSALLFERIREAMLLQTSTMALCLDSDQLRLLHEAFEAACDLVEQSEIPSTVIHGDMNAGNILFDGQGCQFIDWCEAYVGFPFVTLQHLLLLNPFKNEQQRMEAERALILRYCAAFDHISTESGREHAIACMPVLAAASAMYGRGKWLDVSLRNDVRRQVHVRTLARHMHEATHRPEFVELLASRSTPAVSGRIRKDGQKEDAYAATHC